MAALSRAMMAVAVRCLPAHRRGWGMAMEAEFEAAVADRHALPFALGCLAMSLRGLPAHDEGRRAIAGYLVALGLLLPVAALLLAGVLGGVPGFRAAEIVIHSPAAGARGGVPVTEANVSGVPGLVLLVLALVAGHLRLAWLMLEQDWSRVMAAWMLNAAAAATLVAAAGVLFLGDPRVLIQAGVVLVELGIVSALERWDARAELWPPGEVRPT